PGGFAEGELFGDSGVEDVAGAGEEGLHFLEDDFVGEHATDVGLGELRVGEEVIAEFLVALGIKAALVAVESVQGLRVVGDLPVGGVGEVEVLGEGEGGLTGEGVLLQLGSAEGVVAGAQVYAELGVAKEAFLGFTRVEVDAEEVALLSLASGGAGAGHGSDGEDEGDDEARSEEHTSELQSRENLVCRLLLEKK